MSTVKKLITIEFIAILALALFSPAPAGLAPGVAHASEVTGTLSSDANITTGSEDDGSIDGSVDDDDDTSGSIGGSVDGDDTTGTIGGTVGSGNTISGTVGGGGSGGGGGGGGGGDDDDDDGEVLGATSVNLPDIPSAGFPIPLTQSFVAQAPGLPNTGEQPYTTDATVPWIVMIGSVLGVFSVSFWLARSLQKI